MKNSTSILLVLLGFYSCELLPDKAVSFEDRIKSEIVLIPQFETPFLFENISIKFPGPAVVDTFFRRDLTVFFAYYVFDDGFDTIVYSAQFVKLPQLSMVMDCFKKKDCIQDFVEGGIEGGLNNGAFELIEQGELEIFKNHSKTSFTYADKEDGMRSKGMMIFTRNNNIILQVSGKPIALKKIDPIIFFESLDVNNPSED